MRPSRRRRQLSGLEKTVRREAVQAEVEVRALPSSVDPFVFWVGRRAKAELLDALGMLRSTLARLARGRPGSLGSPSDGR